MLATELQSKINRRLSRELVLVSPLAGLVGNAET